MDELVYLLRELALKSLNERPDDDGMRGSGYAFEKGASSPIDLMIECRIEAFAQEEGFVFIGEESARDLSLYDRARTSERVLIADPIDGTANYLRSGSENGSYFATQAVAFDSDRTFGIIAYPALDMEVRFEHGSVLVNNKPIEIADHRGTVRISGSVPNAKELRELFPAPFGLPL